MKIVYNKKTDVAYIHLLPELPFGNQLQLGKDLEFVVPQENLAKIDFKIYIDDRNRIVGFEITNASCGLRPDVLDSAISSDADALNSEPNPFLELKYDPQANAGALNILSSAESTPKWSTNFIAIPPLDPRYGAQGEIVLDFDTDEYLTSIEILWTSRCLRAGTLLDYATKYDDDYEDLE